MNAQKNNSQAITFDELEKAIHEYHQRQAREDLKYILETADEWLFKNRDKYIFELLAKKQTTHQTLFGEVSYERRYYNTMTPFGDIKKIYLLDAILETETIGAFTLQAAAMIRKLRDEKLSYRNIALNIKETCGIDVTRQAIPGVLFAYNKYIKKLEQETG